MDISKDDQRAALHAHVHNLLAPRWLRWTLGITFTATVAPFLAGLLHHSAQADTAAEVGLAAYLLTFGYWLLRARLVERRTKRDPREVAVGAAALALRRAGVDGPLRQVRVTMVGGPWDGDVVPLLLTGPRPWPETVCPTVGGVCQHYRLEHVDADTRATYLYVGECASGAQDG